jgi:hypothetical protein
LDEWRLVDAEFDATSGVEVAGVELIGGTNLGRGSRDRRRDSRQGHAVRAGAQVGPRGVSKGDVAGGRVHPEQRRVAR